MVREELYTCGHRFKKYEISDKFWKMVSHNFSLNNLNSTLIKHNLKNHIIVMTKLIVGDSLKCNKLYLLEKCFSTPRATSESQGENDVLVDTI